jgi:signal transduction histidine kinase/CheY-like chemotaxis protein
MRLPPVVAAVPLLLLLLTWLSMRAINPEAELFDRALGALDRFAVAESALQRDVLSARAGMLRNYDPLVREAAAMDESLARLRETVSDDIALVDAVDRLSASVAQQESLVEQFKSDNALLQNSLAYFGRYSASLGADRNGPLVPAVSALAAAMLHFTLDTSPAVVREVESRLAGLGAQPAPSADAAAVQALLAHGRMLHDLLPQTDDSLTALSALRQRPDQEAVRALILTRQAASRAAARHFRQVLYVVSLLLVGVLVHLGIRLRARARALQRRAAFEHVLAGVSTRFIDAQPDAIGAHVEQALAELGEHIGADRAYFVLSDAPAELRAWSREGIGYPRGWPARAPELAARFGPAADGVVHIADVGRLPENADRNVLAAAGVRGWVCVPRLDGDGVRAILGFDALRPWTTRPDELGLLRMALDAVANAVGRRSLERERARLEQHLQQARRMETVGALASGIAHNFNNIVGAILGHAEMAEAQVPSHSRPGRNLGEIRRAGERARDLVDQILAFGRRRDGRRGPVSVHDLLAEAAALLHVSLPSGIELVVHQAPESAVVFGERAQLLQVILNLCNNAAQAIDGPGRIDVDAVLEETARARSLSHGDLAPGLHVRMAVSDAGRGMDEETLERIFEPFFTTRAAGNGLGLATVREIVREHGGAMDVRSTPGAGSRFEAWLPCVAAATSAPGTERRALPLGQGETVLVIDDERRQLLRDEEILAALGYEPVGFARAEDALTACREARERFDVLVVGRLPSPAAALEAAAALHAIVPDAPILLATASADEIGTNSLVAAGILDVVRRPIVASEIARALADCSATSRSRSKARPGPDRAA